MIRQARAILLLALAVLAGCHVDQAKEVALYRKEIDLPPTTRTSAEPLLLRDALLLANANNETLAARGEQYLRAVIGRQRNLASFQPTVDLVGSQSLDKRVSNQSSSNHELDISADLQWNVFNGFRDVNRYWSDTFFIEQRRRDMLTYQEQLLLDVARVYFQILRSEASVRVLDNSLDVQEERLRFTRGQRDAGRARPLDVAQTEAQVSATRTLLIDARHDVQNSREVLALLTGSAVRDAQVVDRFSVPADFPGVDAYLATARGYRDDIRAAAAAVEAAKRDVEVAFGQYYPTVSLNLSGFLYRESTPDGRTWESLLTASVPIFSAGRIHGDVREAWSFAREAMLVRNYLDRQVIDQVSRAHHDLLASGARLAELKIRLTAAEQAFEQAEASYRVGLATNLDRVVAQDALLDSQLQYSSEEFNRKVFYLTLYQSVGLLREGIVSPEDAIRAVSATQPATLPVAER